MSLDKQELEKLQERFAHLQMTEVSVDKSLLESHEFNALSGEVSDIEENYEDTAPSFDDSATSKSSKHVSSLSDLVSNLAVQKLPLRMMQSDTKVESSPLGNPLSFSRDESTLIGLPQLAPLQTPDLSGASYLATRDLEATLLELSPTLDVKSLANAVVKVKVGDFYFVELKSVINAILHPIMVQNNTRALEALSTSNSVMMDFIRNVNAQLGQLKDVLLKVSTMAMNTQESEKKQREAENIISIMAPHTKLYPPTYGRSTIAVDYFKLLTRSPEEINALAQKLQGLSELESSRVLHAYFAKIGALR